MWTISTFWDIFISQASLRTQNEGGGNKDYCTSLHWQMDKQRLLQRYMEMFWLFMSHFHIFQPKREAGFVIQAVIFAISECKYYTFTSIVVYTFQDRWLCFATQVVSFHMKNARDFIFVLNFLIQKMFFYILWYFYVNLHLF